jgi:L-lysine exporter family protein LysE/ArgO
MFSRIEGCHSGAIRAALAPHRRGSSAWFALLGYGARWLAPWFGRPRAWQLLEGLIAATMFVMSALLLRQALAGA